MNVGKETEDYGLVNIDNLMLKIEDLKFQLEHHAKYFENRRWDVSENSREISEKKLELEYFTYHKIFNNLSEEVKQIREIVAQPSKG
jgi:hypothetical protein